MQLFNDLFRTKLNVMIIIKEDYNIGDIIFSYHNLKIMKKKNIVLVVFDFVEKSFLSCL